MHLVSVLWRVRLPERGEMIWSMGSFCKANLPIINTPRRPCSSRLLRFYIHHAHRLTSHAVHTSSYQHIPTALINNPLYHHNTTQQICAPPSSSPRPLWPPPTLRAARPTPPYVTRQLLLIFHLTNSQFRSPRSPLMAPPFPPPSPTPTASPPTSP